MNLPPMSLDSVSTFRWLRTGEEALIAMLAAITGAQHSIRLETYTYTASPLGEKFREALVRACHRGVRVQVMIDALGSVTLPASFWDPLIEAGGDFKWFNPLTLHRLIYRNHRKVLACDDHIAFVGGFNIAPEYDGDGATRGWRDLGLEITGLLAKELADAFDTLFTGADFKHKRLQRFRKNGSDLISLGQNWQLLLSGPGRRHGTFKRILARDLVQATIVKIICAYFLPTWRIRKELLRICRRGGQVQLILAGKSDLALSQLAGRRLYDRFLRCGVEIYEYQPQILHAKLFIMDEIVYVGSANLDARSLDINYELMVRICDPPLAAEAQRIFADDLKQCRRIEPTSWRASRTIWVKLMERWAYFILARIDPYVARRQVKTLR